MNAEGTRYVDSPQGWDRTPQGQHVTMEEGACPSNMSDGNGHCVHWWDGEPCCWCHFDGGDKGDA